MINPEQKEAKQTIGQHRNQILTEYGWIVDYVFDAINSETGIDIHTHGLSDNFDHSDLQIVLPLEADTAHGILATAIEQIKQGKQFITGQTYDDILKDEFKIIFIEAQQENRTVLRMILPDVNGNLEQDKLEGNFLKQYAQSCEEKT